MCVWEKMVKECGVMEVKLVKFKVNEYVFE